MPQVNQVHFPQVQYDPRAPGPSPLTVGGATPYPSLAAEYFYSQPGEQPGDSSSRMYALCLASDAIGALVYAYDGQTDTVRTADSNLPNPVIGLIVAKKDDTHCTVQKYGPVFGLYSGLTTQARYFVHHNGELIAPSFEGTDVRFVQQVGYALSPTAFFLQPTGTVIERDVGAPDTAVRIGNGAPVAGQDYPLQDLYIDLDSGELSFSPAQDPKKSNVLAGHGAPTPSNPGSIMDAYFDQDTGDFYLQNESNNGISELVVGHGPPIGNPQSVSGKYYLDAQTASIYEES